MFLSQNHILHSKAYMSLTLHSKDTLLTYMYFEALLTSFQLSDIEDTEKFFSEQTHFYSKILKSTLVHLFG